jgi:hypothetical protein
MVPVLLQARLKGWCVSHGHLARSYQGLGGPENSSQVLKEASADFMFTNQYVLFVRTCLLFVHAAVGALATIWATKLISSAAAKAIDGDQATQDSSSEAADSKRGS